MEKMAESAVSKLGQVLAEELRKIRGVGEKVVHLRDELATMKAALRMFSEAEESTIDHLVREWAYQVRELADDAEDCVDMYWLRIRRPLPLPPIFVGGLVTCARNLHGRVKLLPNIATRQVKKLLLRRELASDVEALRARTTAINDRRGRYGIDRETLHRSSCYVPVSAASVSASALRTANDPNKFVGIQEYADILAQMVKAPNESDKKLKVFSIFGFGGLGKTTLAIKVCQQLVPEFPHQAQVSVSQAFDGSKDVDELLKRVLQQIIKSRKEGHDDNNEEEVDTGERKLEKVLQNKRCLIVIDDVWSIAAWDAILSKLPDNSCDSRVIVTTRMETVAKACSSANNYMYRIQPLNEEYSKKLFLSRAFGSINASYPVELEEAMQKILKKCGGLPLAIVGLASLLASYNSSEHKDMWDTICRSIGSQMDNNPTLEGMKEIVTLSYNHLPYHLKCCIMYLSIFPEDYIIGTDRLLNRWIAEGLVEDKRGLTLMEVAKIYLDELISRSMIDPVAYSEHDGRVETCRVHDMMLEVMVSKSLETNFVSLVGGQYAGMSYDRTRRLSIHGGKENTAVRLGRRDGIKHMDVQHTRSLSMFGLEWHNLLDRLGEFRLLRVLDMENCTGLEDRHMKDICRMYLLRYLNLSGTNISNMPEKVGELEHLEVLDASCTYLKGLPSSVTKLVRLQRLIFTNKYDWTHWWVPSEGLSRMKALVEVKRLGIKNIVDAEELGELEQLRAACIYIDSDEDTVNKLALSLRKIYSLRSLDMKRGGDEKSSKTLNFLHELDSSPPRLLQFLKLQGTLSELPHWVGSLTHLVEVDISRALLNDENEQLFGVLSKAPNLRSIILQLNFYGRRELVARTDHKFLALKKLVVSLYGEFPKVFTVEEGSMRNLEALSLEFEDKEGSRFCGIKHLESIKEVHLWGQKQNSALDYTLKELKSESDSRPNSRKFKVTPVYQ